MGRAMQIPARRKSTVEGQSGEAESGEGVGRLRPAPDPAGEIIGRTESLDTFREVGTIDIEGGNQRISQDRTGERWK